MKTLIYCTDQYPADLYSEKAFVDCELPALLQKFDKVILVPCDPGPHLKCYEKSLPERVDVDFSLAEYRPAHSRLRKLRYAFHPFVIKSLAKMTTEAHTPKQWGKGLYQSINTVVFSEVIEQILRRRHLTPSDTVLYSLWFRDLGSALARLGRKGWKAATRAHTSDLYDHQIIFRSRRLRNHLLSGLQHVFTISEAGCKYMQERYPKHKNRIECIPLGSTRLFTPTIADTNAQHGDYIRICTVARIHPVKQHELILDTLRETAQLLPDKRIIWEVIGDGSGLEGLKAKAIIAETTNFKVAFFGALANEEIQRRFSQNPPDWYIMMSKSEGTPVSMAEAMSYGIPAITTDVGSIFELTSEECAINLGAATHPAKEYAQCIATTICDNGRRAEMGKAARLRWESKLDSQKLSARMAQKLSKLI